MSLQGKFLQAIKRYERAKRAWEKPPFTPGKIDEHEAAEKALLKLALVVAAQSRRVRKSHKKGYRKVILEGSLTFETIIYVKNGDRAWQHDITELPTPKGNQNSIVKQVRIDLIREG
jgi:hypothetical protein